MNEIDDRLPASQRLSPLASFGLGVMCTITNVATFVMVAAAVKDHESGAAAAMGMLFATSLLSTAWAMNGAYRSRP